MIDGWMDEWVDGWIDMWMDGRVNVSIHRSRSLFVMSRFVSISAKKNKLRVEEEIHFNVLYIIV